VSTCVCVSETRAGQRSAQHNETTSHLKLWTGAWAGSSNSCAVSGRALSLPPSPCK
jgi:hypothetical protein